MNLFRPTIRPGMGEPKRSRPDPYVRWPCFDFLVTGVSARDRAVEFLRNKGAIFTCERWDENRTWCITPVSWSDAFFELEMQDFAQERISGHFGDDQSAVHVRGMVRPPKGRQVRTV